MPCHGEYHSSPFCRSFYTGEHPQSQPQVQADVGTGTGATFSDDAGATPDDSFHAGNLSSSSTLGSPIDDGCGPGLEPRPVCEGEEPHASHLPGLSPP